MDTRQRQSRDTGNIGHKIQENPETLETLNTRHKTIQRHWQRWTQDPRQSRDTGNTGHKTQDKDNPETLATLDTRHKTKTIQRH
jgi:hypothetical protein